jgi:Bacterial Ig domain
MSRLNVFGALALAGAFAFAMNCNNSTPNNPTPKPTLQLLAPIGGESYKVGSTVNVRWTINDKTKVSSVKLELSTDDGVLYAVLANKSFSYPDTSYSWTVDSTQVSSKCLIMISDYVDRSITDQSKEFTVTQ